ncbi:MAG: carboxypeptidase regulatory-like domain-containing protein [Bryobacterales bacterium]|nr:carboxypeptidase regulatory-like domain-containing protein [Bryobacterales bacterium]
MMRLIVLLLVTVSFLFAQSTAVRIAGTITDATGSVVPNATATAKNVETGVERTTRSNETGTYVLYPLPPGVYHVTVEAKGFRTERIENLRVDVGAVLTRNVSLQLGTVQEQVVVSADAAPIFTQSASLESTIVREQIDTLPLNGRDFNQLVTLAAGAVDNNVGGGTDFGAVAVNGNRSYSNDYLLDGTPNNNLYQNRSAAPLSVDLIREFKVTSGVAAAEYGQAGTQVSVVSRSGTNRFHGSAFEFYRGNALQARDPFNTMEQQPFRRHQFGGSLGGPIRKDKTFFFVNYEGNRQKENVTKVSTVPPDAFWSGDFSQLLPRVAITDPLASRQPFAGNRIPASRLDRSALQLRPFTSSPTSPGLANNLLKFPEETNNADQFTVRLDQTLPANQSLAFRYTHSDTGGFIPNLIGTPGVGRTEPADSRNATLTWTAPLGPRMVNELRFGAMNFSNIATYFNGSLPSIEQLGWRGFEPGNPGIPALPQIQFTGTDAFSPFKYGGTATFGEAALSMINNVFTLADAFSMTRGNHQIKIGFEGRRIYLNALQQTNARGQITFQGANSAVSTGYSFAGYLLGLPASSQEVPVKPKVLLMQNEIATYIQDDWRVTRHLTLSFGLRHELFLNPVEERNRLGMFDPDSGAIVVASDNGRLPTNEFLPLIVSRLTNAQGQWRFPLLSDQEAGANPRRLLNTQYRNWGPRFGFVHQMPSAKMVVRGGYGIFYSRYPIQYLLQTVGINPPFAGLFTYSQAIQNGQPQLRLDSPYLTAGGSASVSPAGLERNFGLPDNQQWNLTIERSLGWHTVASLGYVGNKGSNLFRTINANGLFLNPATGQVQRRFANTFGTSSVSVRRSDGNSTYHAMQLELRRRYRKGLIFQGNWTWAKGLDDVGGTVQAALLDLENLGRDRANSDYVRRHVVNINATWEMPWRHRLFGGWRLSSIWRYTTGRYLTPTFTATGGLANNRPDVVAGVSPNLPGGERSASRWFNANAFEPAPAVDPVNGQPRFGNAGRNTILGPGINVMDASMAKVFRVHEGHNVTFRLEFFNVLNHPNYGAPVTNISSVNTVGRIDRVIRPMRQAQFVLRYDF